MSVVKTLELLQNAAMAEAFIKFRANHSQKERFALLADVMKMKQEEMGRVLVEWILSQPALVRALVFGQVPAELLPEAKRLLAEALTKDGGPVFTTERTPLEGGITTNDEGDEFEQGRRLVKLGDQATRTGPPEQTSGVPASKGKGSGRSRSNKTA